MYVALGPGRTRSVTFNLTQKERKDNLSGDHVSVHVVATRVTLLFVDLRLPEPHYGAERS